MYSNNVVAHKRLVDHGVKPSPQRLAIMEYLVSNPTHPTVDAILESVKVNIPTISRTTVYNTLNLLVDKGAALILTIDDKSCRYDANIDKHAHFRCKSCGMILDLKYTPPAIKQEDIEGYKISTSEYFLYGLCPKCIDNSCNQ